MRRQPRRQLPLENLSLRWWRWIRGGYPDMVMWMAVYFFDHPQFIYNPRETTTRASWTASPVKGHLLADKPVYLLVSSRTASAAEQFAYNMKMLRRAALVGATTSGKTHTGLWRWAETRASAPINPYGDKAWDGVGVSVVSVYYQK
ncbi:MAG: S41 family peptidase [Bryobacteraceae bacterium]